MKMTNKETESSNKLIAEFMGYRQRENGGLYWGNEGLGGIYTKEMKYHSSWDWLMPVVEKIESLGFWTKIQAHTSFDNLYKSCDIKKQKPRSDGDYLYNYEGDWVESKIKAVYNAVVEFIKFYNEK